MHERSRRPGEALPAERETVQSTAPSDLGATSPPAALAGLLARQPAGQRARVVEGLSHSAGNRAVGGWLARQPAPPKAPPEKVVVDAGFFDAENNQQLAAAGRLAVGELERDMTDLEGSSKAWALADEWVHTVNAWLPYLDAKGNEPIEKSIASQVGRLMKEYLEIRKAIGEEKADLLRESYRSAQRAAEKAAEEAEALQPKLDDALRAAFRKGSSSTVKEAVSTVKSAISIGRNLRTLAFDISKEIFNLSPPSGTKIYVRQPWDLNRPIRLELVNVSRYTDMLTKLGRGLAVINIALTIADRSKRATAAEQGMKDLNDVVGVSTDMGTVVGGLAPHMSLITTMYIKPMLKAITAQISHLVEELSEINRAYVEATGDLMYPNVEPGGQPMFDFMVAVMHADSVDQVPKIDDEVEEYLFDQRDKLEEGAEEEVPTSGWWLWKGLATGEARHWVFRNRKRVWAMFYGSLRAPAKRK
jgi:hypothetical protein